MFAYQIRLALISMRRNPVLSALLVGAIALGIGVSSAFVTVHYLFAADPIPHKSDRLFYVEIDSWDPTRPFDNNHPERPPDQLTYRDMQAIRQSDIPTYQTAMFKAALTVHPGGDGEGRNHEGARPYREEVRMCYSGFFPLFEVPFTFGGGWDKQADESLEPVVVINAETNRKLFGGADSVGKTLRIEDREFTIVGVLDQWRPPVKYYDPHNGPFQDPEAIFMPFDFVREFEAFSAGNTNAWTNFTGIDFEDYLMSEFIWIQMWVQLDRQEQRDAYQSFLDAYVFEQQQLGRLQRPLNNRLLDVMAWLDENEVVPAETIGIMLIGVLFLVVCSVNLIGILLGKFLARAPEVGVRRALGASRWSVFLQHLLECELIGVFGGVLGLLLSAGVLQLFNRMLDSGRQFYLDLPMVLAGLILALGAGFIAGIYPAWRICRVAPATHLKLQ